MAIVTVENMSDDLTLTLPLVPRSSGIDPSPIRPLLAVKGAALSASQSCSTARLWGGRHPEVIAARLGVSGETLRLVAKRFAETYADVWATVGRKKRAAPPVPSPVTGEVEARLIALACTAPPAGRSRWSLGLRRASATCGFPNREHWRGSSARLLIH